jgi:hypothetical protein
VKALVLIPVVESYKGRHNGIWKNKPVLRTDLCHYERIVGPIDEEALRSSYEEQTEGKSLPSAVWCNHHVPL